MPVTTSLVARLSLDDSPFRQGVRRAAAYVKQELGQVTGAAGGREAARTLSGGAAGGRTARSPLDRQQAAIAAELSRTHAALATAMAGGSREAQQLASRFHALSAAERQEAVSAREALSSLRDREGASRRLGASMRELGGTLTAGVTVPLVSLGIASVRSATQMDSLMRGLVAVTGSSEAASEQLGRLREIAKLPGLGRVEAIQGAIQLQAAGFSAETAEKSLLAFGNALATVGKGKAELSGVTLALSQIAAKGKVSAEEINQLAERVPQIRQAMRGAFGTANTEELQKMGIGARRFIEGINRELLKLPRVTGGVQNSFENLQDTMSEAFTTIGQNVLPTLMPILEGIAGAVTDLTRRFAELPQPVRTGIVVLAGLAAATGPALIGMGQLITGLQAVKGVAPGVVTKIKDIGTALLSAPGWTKVAVAAVGLMALAWQKDFLGIRTTVTGFVQWVSPTLIDTWHFIKEETSAILADMVAGFQGFVADARLAFQGIGTLLSDALIGPFAGLGEKLQAMAPELKTVLTTLFKNTPIGQLVSGAADFAQQFINYTNTRNFAQEKAEDYLRRNRKVEPRARRQPNELDDQVARAKKLTPLQQEMQALQGRLNQAWATQDALLGNLNPKVAELAGQYRNVFEQGKEGIQFLKDVIGAEEDAARAMARARMDPGVMAAERSLQRTVSGPQRLQSFKDQLEDMQLTIKELSGEDPGGLLRLKKDFGDVVGDKELRRMAEARTAIQNLQRVISGWQQYNQQQFEMRVFDANQFGQFLYTPEQRQAMLMFNQDWEKLTDNQKRAGAEFLKTQRVLILNKQAADRLEEFTQNLAAADFNASVMLNDAQRAFEAFSQGGDVGRLAFERLGVRLQDLPQDARKAVTATLKEMMRFEELRSVMENLMGGLQDVFRRGFESIATDGFGGFFKSIYQGFRQLLVQMAAEFLSSHVRRLLMGTVGGIFTQAAGAGAAGGGGGLAGAGLTVPQPKLAFAGGLGGAASNSFPNLTLPAPVVTQATSRGGGGNTVIINVPGDQLPGARRNAGMIATRAASELSRQKIRNGY